jgi:hypothetical protein
MNSTIGTSNMRFFHVREENEVAVTFAPRIPNNTLTKTGNENATIPRVCFAPSVDQCLMAMCNGYGVYHVYEPEDYGKLHVVMNTKKFVPDASITDEIWSLTETKLKKIGSIYVYDYPEWDEKFYLHTKVNGKYYGTVGSWYWKNIC